METQKNRLNIALLSPNESRYSETFIQRHREGLLGKVFYYHSGKIPTYCEKTKLDDGSLFNENERVLLESEREIRHLYYLQKSFHENKIDLVFAEYGVTAAESISAVKGLALPLIVHFHGFDASVSDVISEYKERYIDIFEYAKYVIAVSKSMRKSLIELGCSSKKIILAPCGAGPEFFDISPLFQNKQVAAVGRLVEKKSPHFTILAFRDVLSEHPDATLHLAGDGPYMDQCRKIIKSYRLEKNIHLLGSINSDEIKKLFGESSVFVQHSVTSISGDSEGTPVGIMEAGAAGLPVIATRHAGIIDVIDKDSGFLVQEYDLAEMTKSLVAMLSDLSDARKKGNHLKQVILEKFTLEASLGKLNSVITSIEFPEKKSPWSVDQLLEYAQHKKLFVIRAKDTKIRGLLKENEEVKKKTFNLNSSLRNAEFFAVRLNSQISEVQYALEKASYEKRILLQSKSYRLGDLFFRSIKRPLKVLSFPVNALKLLMSSREVVGVPATKVEPLVSVVMTAYNAEKYVRESVQSIRDQTYNNLEIIVISDASTDSTVDILSEIAAEDIRLKVIDSPSNHGTYWSKNFAIMFAKGEYIITQDSDDTCHNCRIENQLAALQGLEGAVASFCDYVRVAPSGEWLLNRGLPSRSALMGGLYHKSVFQKFGYFDTVRYAADSEMVERLARHAKNQIVQTGEQHYYLRIVENSLTNTDKQVDFDCVQKNDRDTFFLSEDRQKYVSSYRKAHESIEDLLPIQFPPKENLFNASSNATKNIRYSRKIIAAMASYPKRYRKMVDAFQSILPQVDHLYVYLNEYDFVPDILKNEKITVILGKDACGNIKDNGKFYFVSQVECDYYFTIDDDIVYPTDYINKMVAKMQFYGDCNTVGVHGIVIPKIPDRYFSKSRKVCHFRNALKDDLPVNAIGTGTLGIPFSLLSTLTIDEMENPGMVDIYFARYCKKNKIPITCIERDSLWLKPLEMDDGLFNADENNDIMHTRLVKEVEPWSIIK